MGHLNLETLARLVDDIPELKEAEHIASCEACASRLEALRDQTEQLRSLPELVPPQGDWQVLEARLRSEGLIRDPGLFALYFHFGVDGIGIGGGIYQPDRENLSRIRRAIKRDGEVLVRALNRKRFKDLYGSLQGERNVRLPVEFASEVERYPLIANKQFYYYVEYADPRMVLRKDLADLVMRHYEVGREVNGLNRIELERLAHVLSLVERRCA